MYTRCGGSCVVNMNPKNVNTHTHTHTYTYLHTHIHTQYTHTTQTHIHTHTHTLTSVAPNVSLLQPSVSTSPAQTQHSSSGLVYPVATFGLPMLTTSLTKSDAKRTVFQCMSWGRGAILCMSWGGGIILYELGRRDHSV